MSKKGQRQRRLLESSAPPSGQKPSMNLATKDVEAIAEELVSYHALFHDLFVRPEQRHWSEFYLRGQLSMIERKTVEPMVLALKGSNLAAVRAVQQFLGEGAWDDEAIIVRHQRLVGESLGETDGAVIFDGSGFPKQGNNSVGVARQYCGALGKIANCQQGVFAAYASARGYTFLDHRLYMPEQWFDQAHTERRARCGVPEELRFQTEPKLAIEMLRGLVQRGQLPFKWVVADEHYGMNPAFLEAIDALGKWYFVEVPVSTKVWLKEPKVEPPGRGPMGRPRKYVRVVAGEPEAEEVRQLAGRLPKKAWKPYTIKEGSKGPIVAEFAFVRATMARRGQPTARVWVVFRRSTDEDGQLKVYLSNASRNCAHAEMVRVSGMRWPVESAIEEAKGEVGMDHYETRTWRGWHHHMTQTILAHHFLVRMRLKLKKSASDDGRAGQGIGSDGVTPERDESRRSDQDRTVSSGKELRSLSVASKANLAKVPQTEIAA